MWYTAQISGCFAVTQSTSVLSMEAKLSRCQKHDVCIWRKSMNLPRLYNDGAWWKMLSDNFGHKYMHCIWADIILWFLPKIKLHQIWNWLYIYCQNGKLKIVAGYVRTFSETWVIQNCKDFLLIVAMMLCLLRNYSINLISNHFEACVLNQYKNNLNSLVNM